MRITWMIALLPACLQGWGQPGWMDAGDHLLHVLAESGLRIRNEAGEVVRKADYGTALVPLSEVQSLHADTVEGLPGSWVSWTHEGQTLRAFDAYLIPISPPGEEESWMAWLERVAGSQTVPRRESLYEDWGGPSGERLTGDLHNVTAGQALCLFRMLVRRNHGDFVDGYVEDEQRRYQELMTLPWNMAEPLRFYHGSEGGGCEWQLNLDVRPTYGDVLRFQVSHACGSC